MSSSQPPSSSQPQTSASTSTSTSATVNRVSAAAPAAAELLAPISGSSSGKNDGAAKQAPSNTSSSEAYRDEYDEEDADDDDDVDPRYAIDSYQSSSKSSAPGGISSSSAQPSNKHVVVDAASSNATGNQNRAGISHSGQQARGSQLPAWGSAALARGQNQMPEQQQGIPNTSSRSILPDHFSYATSHGVQLSSLCFAAWAFPPFSSVLVLVWETENDPARFHAYQAGICGVALVLLLYFLRSWLGLYTLSIIVGMGGLGWFWVCGSAASNNAPTLERVPFIAYAGPLAEQWLGDE